MSLISSKVLRVLEQSLAAGAAAFCGALAIQPGLSRAGISAAVAAGIRVLCGDLLSRSASDQAASPPQPPIAG